MEELLKLLEGNVQEVIGGLDNLDIDQLKSLLEAESTHQNRKGVVTEIVNRMQALVDADKNDGDGDGDSNDESSNETEPEAPEEPTATVVVPHPFKLTLDDHSTVKYGVGVQEMPISHLNHPYTQANGVMRYKPKQHGK